MEAIKTTYKNHKKCRSLDKLEQLRNDTNKTTVETYNKRAKSKYIQEPIINALIKLNSPLKDAYINTLKCSTYIKQDGNKLTSKYCKNRWCLVCNRIQTGKLINGYNTTVSNWAEPYFLTLTIPNVAAEEIENTIKTINHTWRKILNNNSKQKNRPLNGIKKIEITYNSRLNNYHPHLHILTENFYIAEILLFDWLKHFSTAKPEAQDLRPATSPKELFKYVTKLTAKAGNTYYKNGIKAKQAFYPVALDNIFCALKGVRTIQPFGNVKIVNYEVEDLKSETLENIENKEDIFIFDKDNFYSILTGEALTNYCPDEKTNLYRENILYLPKEKKPPDE
jgi:plasmid rolling circle replication initiator protein Rep